MAEVDVDRVLGEVERGYARLWAVVGGGDAVRLGERPGGEWSAIDHVRHLLFAEQLHLGRFGPGPVEWHRLGLPPTGMQAQKRFAALDVGAEPGVSEVLEAWAAVHAELRPFLAQDDDRVRAKLGGHLRHVGAHLRVIERRLRDPKARGSRRREGSFEGEEQRESGHHDG
ncbi:MAG: DinB family protein [Dehalococcoidia bacterium]|nr:DinB family protein [Dehalococcoidia bacterium]